MARKRVSRRRLDVEESSGNVFRDLGFPDAGTELAKAELANRIVTLIEDLDLTQRRAAEILGIDQPGISHLVRGNLKRFSMDRLFRFLNALDRDIEIVVRPKPRSRARALVRVASSRKKSRRTA